MIWFLSVSLLTHSPRCVWKWISFTVPSPPPPSYFGLIGFFCLLAGGSPVHLIPRPASLSLIDPLWEKQQASYTKSFKSFQIVIELVYALGQIWNCSPLSWGASTSCRKVNLGHFPIPCMMSNCSCEWIQIKAGCKCGASQSSEPVTRVGLCVRPASWASCLQGLTTCILS